LCVSICVVCRCVLCVFWMRFVSSMTAGQAERETDRHSGGQSLSELHRPVSCPFMIARDSLSLPCPPFSSPKTSVERPSGILASETHTARHRGGVALVLEDARRPADAVPAAEQELSVVPHKPVAPLPNGTPALVGRLAKRGQQSAFRIGPICNAKLARKDSHGQMDGNRRVKIPHRGTKATNVSRKTLRHRQACRSSPI